jgi:hypothetical protein
MVGVGGMDIFEIKQNSINGNIFKAEVFAPSADKALEEYSKGRYFNDDVTRSNSKEEELTIIRKKQNME